jgi:glycosyltransferase involved in cell wall biosynthesis
MGNILHGRNEPSNLIFVLGMHRSGTSAITRGLQVLGVSLGENLLPPVLLDNPKGYFEDVDFAAFNAELLRAVDSDWNMVSAINAEQVQQLIGLGYISRASNLLKRKMADDKANAYAFKDPRAAKLIQFWNLVFEDAGLEPSFVLPFRNPLSVVKSLNKRGDGSGEYGYLLWLNYVIESLRGTAGRNRILVEYDNFIQSPELGIHRLSNALELNINQDELYQYKNFFLDETLRHSQYDVNDLALDPMCPPCVLEIYSSLQSLVVNNISIDHPGMLAEINKWEAELERIQPLLNLVDRKSHQIARQGHALTETMSERDEGIANLAKTMVKHDEEIAHLVNTMAERDAEIAHLVEMTVDRDYQISSLSDTINEIRRSSSWILTSPIRKVGTCIRRFRNRMRFIKLILSECFIEKKPKQVIILLAERLNLATPLRNTLLVVRLVISTIRFVWARVTYAEVLSLAIKSLRVMRRGGLKLLISKVDSFRRLREMTYGTKSSYEYNWRRIIWRQINKNRPSELNRDRVISPRQVPSIAESVRGVNLPLITLLTPVYNTDLVMLTELFDSVRSQNYPHWQWVLVDDMSPNRALTQKLAQLAETDERIKLIFRSKNGGISAATNDALMAAQGQFVGLLDHDDILAHDALFHVAEVINAWPDVDFIYSDEDKIDSYGNHFEPYFKPDWSPYHLLTRMFTGHFTVYRRSLVEKVGGFRSEYDGTQDYDLALRIAEVTSNVVHIPRILYHWRVSASSAAGNQSTKSYAIDRQKKALENALLRRGVGGEIHPTVYPGNWRPYFALPVHRPLISIVIPTAGRSAKVRGAEVSLIEHCISSILKNSSYENFELVVVHNGDLSESDQNFLKSLDKVNIVEYSAIIFNLAEKINLGVDNSSGDYVVLLNDDTEVITSDWIESMLRIAQHDDIGAVGAKLFYENGTVQHAGVVFMHQGPTHAYIATNAENPGENLVNILLREVIAVTGACLMCRKDRFLKVGGFDEGFPLNYNDVDFCLKLRQSGWQIVYEPSAQLYHYESVSKTGTYDEELERFVARWGYVDDPFYNENYDRTNPFFQSLPYSICSDRNYERWLAVSAANRISRSDGSPVSEILYSFVTSAYNTAPTFLDELADSVLGQFGARFEWVLLDNGSTDLDTIEILKAIGNRDARVRLIRVEDNLGIIGGMQEGIKHARGDYVLPLDSDDLLTTDALLAFDQTIRETGFKYLYYSDEDKTNGSSARMSPFLKPDWDPVMFLNCCYVAHLCAINRKKALELEIYSDNRANGCHDWDTFYRFINVGIQPIHVRAVTYSWRMHPQSTASPTSNSKSFTHHSQSFVLRNHLEAKGRAEHYEVVDHPLYGVSGMWRLFRKPKDPVSIKILVVGNAAVSSNISADSYPDVNISLVCDAELAEALREAACAVPIVLVVSDCLVVKDPEWIWEAVGLLEYFDDAVMVGGRVVNSGGDVLWSSGYFGFRDGERCPNEGLPLANSGYYGAALMQRSCDTVSPLLWAASSDFLLKSMDDIYQAETVAELVGQLAINAHQSNLRVISTPFITGEMLPASIREIYPKVRVSEIGKISKRYYPRNFDSDRAFILCSEPGTVEP